MSFASETKNELSRVSPEKKCCMLAEISGFLRVRGSIGLVGGGKFRIKISTDNPAIARHYKKLLQDYFGIETSLEIGQGKVIGKNRSGSRTSSVASSAARAGSKDAAGGTGKNPNQRYIYSIAIDENNLSEQILRETGMLLIKEGNNYFADGIYESIVRTKCCKKSYLRGVFLGAGTMSDPERGYDLEFVLESQTMAQDLRKLINSFSDMSCKTIARGNKHIVYIKKADYISDMLAIMGASSQVFAFEETRIKKSMRSQTTASVNCDNANMDKAIDASMRQIEAIKKIEAGPGISSLPEKLREVAYLRLEHPDISLTALGELCNPPLKKSGINNRVKKIEEAAGRL